MRQSMHGSSVVCLAEMWQLHLLPERRCKRDCKLHRGSLGNACMPAGTHSRLDLQARNMLSTIFSMGPCTTLACLAADQGLLAMLSLVNKANAYHHHRSMMSSGPAVVMKASMAGAAGDGTPCTFSTSSVNGSSGSAWCRRTAPRVPACSTSAAAANGHQLVVHVMQAAGGKACTCTNTASSIAAWPCSLQEPVLRAEPHSLQGCMRQYQLKAACTNTAPQSIAMRWSTLSSVSSCCHTIVVSRPFGPSTVRTRALAHLSNCGETSTAHRLHLEAQAPSRRCEQR